jgi:hypothetical protein
MKRLLTILMLLGLPSAVTGCAGSIKLAADRPQLAKVDPALVNPAPGTNDCAPQTLPDRGLNQSETEHYWGLDRKTIVICNDQRIGERGFNNRIITGLEGKPAK